MQVSLLGVYIRTRNIFTLGRSSRPACSRYMGVRYDVASAQKNCGVDRGGVGQNLLILIDCLSLFPSRRSLRNTYIVTY